MAPAQQPAALAGASNREPTRGHLDHTLVKGIAWTGGLKWVTQVLSWGVTLLIARILTPQDYGLVGMATLYTGFVQLVNEFGLGAAIVRQRDIGEPEIAALGGLSVGLGVGLFGISALAALPLAAFFREPRLPPVVLALSVTFVTSSFVVVPRSLLARELRFKRVAALDATQALSAAMFTLALALAGLGYWALVWGTVLAALVGMSVALRWRPHRLAWPSQWGTISSSLTLGRHVVVSRIAWYLYSNADFGVVGRVLGKAALGSYSLGWTLASIPISRIAGLVGQVIPAILAEVQTKPAEMRRYLYLLTEALAFLTLPVSVGACLVATDFVNVVLGPKWTDAILPLQLLAAYASLRSVTAIYAQFLVAAGRSRTAMHQSLLALVVLPPLFYLGARTHGTAGVASAWIAGYPVVVLPAFIAVLQCTEARLTGYLRSLWPAATCSLVMALAVVAVRLGLPPTMPQALRLGIKIAVGALSYMAVAWLVHGRRVRGYLSVFRMITARSKAR